MHYLNMFTQKTQTRS